jgi:hypothetical protein
VSRQVLIGYSMGYFTRWMLVGAEDMGGLEVGKLSPGARKGFRPGFPDSARLQGRLLLLLNGDG